MSKRKTFVYHVYYGSGSRNRFTTWKECAAFIKYCLDDGFVVKEVTKT